MKKKSRTPSPSIKAQKQDEIKINRAIMRATWVSSIIAFLALVFSIYSIWLSKETRKEDFEVVYAQLIRDIPIQIVEKPETSSRDTTGLLLAYAQIYLSNNGEVNLSIIEHNITEIKDEFGTNEPIQYFPSQNSYYLYTDGKFNQFDYPLTIEGGHSQKIYAQVELTMSPDAYRLIKENYGEKFSSGLSLKTIDDFLSSKGTDLYGNEIRIDSNSNAPSVFITNEQIFLIDFLTSRNTEKSYLFSYYVYNDLYFMPSP
jgi:hypothetical protein